MVLKAESRGLGEPKLCLVRDVPEQEVAFPGTQLLSVPHQRAVCRASFKLGGIPPIARRRSRLAFTLAEREDISRGIAPGSSIREIASRLDRVASTVSRRSRVMVAALLIVPMTLAIQVATTC
jgi:Helix-turn-helix domain